jgi:hypothetical protein
MTAFGIAAPAAHPFQQRLLGALPTGWSHRTTPFSRWP